jgi:hypothetical protein
VRARPLASCGAPSDALGASSFWRTWRPHAHHFSADSLFHGLPTCAAQFSEAHQKRKQEKRKEKRLSVGGERAAFFLTIALTQVSS